MASKYWIKFYIEVLDDPKVARLPDNLWRRYYECCLMAGDVNQDGKLPPISDIAWRLRVDEETLVTEFDQLARNGLLDNKVENVLDDGYWFVTKFATRQAPISGADRVKKHRETKKKQQYYGTGNANETKRYTDIDIDIDKDKEVEVHTNTPFSSLSGFFMTLTSIPELTGGPQRWNEAIQKWLDAGIEEQDIQSAVSILRGKGYTILGPWSVTNTAISEMSKRKTGGTTTPSEPAGFAAIREYREMRGVE